MSQSSLIKTTILCNDEMALLLYAEHGFSVLIEREGEPPVLFDTGKSDVFIKNAKILGKDLSRVESIVISHGHYDHAGGLKYLRSIEKKFKVFIRKEAFLPKYSGERFTGVDWDILREFFDFIYLKDRILEIKRGIYVFGPSPLKTHSEGLDPNFFIINEKEEKVRDFFEDEISLVIEDGNELILITGCAHRGVINIVEDVLDNFDKRIKILIGGFHLYRSSVEKVKEVANRLKTYEIGRILPYHCTGKDFERFIF